MLMVAFSLATTLLCLVVRVSCSSLHVRTSNHTVIWCVNHWMRIRYDSGILMIGGADETQNNGGVHTSRTDCGLTPQGWHFVTSFDLFDVTDLHVTYSATDAVLKSGDNPRKLKCGCEFSTMPSEPVNMICTSCEFTLERSQTPTIELSVQQTFRGTGEPTRAPTAKEDSRAARKYPATRFPTTSPTAKSPPTFDPSSPPSASPSSAEPTESPTLDPSEQPSTVPSRSSAPTREPPTSKPTLAPRPPTATPTAALRLPTSRPSALATAASSPRPSSAEVEQVYSHYVNKTVVMCIQGHIDYTYIHGVAQVADDSFVQSGVERTDCGWNNWAGNTNGWQSIYDPFDYLDVVSVTMKVTVEGSVSGSDNCGVPNGCFCEYTFDGGVAENRIQTCLSCYFDCPETQLPLVHVEVWAAYPYNYTNTSVSAVQSTNLMQQLDSVYLFNSSSVRVLLCLVILSIILVIIAVSRIFSKKRFYITIL
jgi:hypothetical protein